MFASQRRDFIVQAVRAGGAVRVAELAAELGVSEMTVRRDLESLSRSARLVRVHGGATAPLGEPPFAEVVVERFVEKNRIGAAAARLVEDGDTVFVDIGTTALQFVRHLRGRELTIVTSNLAVYEELLPESTIELVLLGGVVRRNYRSLVGFLAEDALRRLSADWAILGASGVDEDLSVLDTTTIEVPIKRAMIAAARRVALLVDSAKFGGRGLARVCGPDAIDVVVTDDGVLATTRAALEQAGVEVSIA